jgi:diguanylate cyclase (GGDEF)-like protein
MAVDSPAGDLVARAGAEIGTPDQGAWDTWDPELAGALYTLLYRADNQTDQLALGIEGLRLRWNDRVFTELIYLLSHLRFEPAEARRHWRSILDHQEHMQSALRVPVDLRVALVSYFVEVNRQLRNPKIIEMRLFEQAQAEAYRDELTGLHNYRLFREYLSQEVLRSRRCGTALSLVMADVDNFKSYNDRGGHEAGNRALAAVARVMRAALRESDVAARYGGEEFALVLPSTTKTAARLVAEQVRQAVERHAFEGGTHQPGGKLTVSLGVATFPADATEATELVRRADRAMYVAKACGKNQVALYGKSRRSFGRIPAAIAGSFRAVTGDAHELTTVNVSQGGLLFRTGRPLPIGTLLDMCLAVPGAPRQIRASGRVVHVESDGAGDHRIALQIIEMTDDDRAVLTDYTRGLDLGSRDGGEAA